MLPTFSPALVIPSPPPRRLGRALGSSCVLRWLWGLWLLNTWQNREQFLMPSMGMACPALDGDGLPSSSRAHGCNVKKTFKLILSLPGLLKFDSMHFQHARPSNRKLNSTGFPISLLKCKGSIDNLRRPRMHANKFHFLSTGNLAGGAPTHKVKPHVCASQLEMNSCKAGLDPLNFV